jgi:hypothetical protein
MSFCGVTSLISEALVKCWARFTPKPFKDKARDDAILN